MKAIILYFGIPALLAILFIGFTHKSSGGKAGFTGSPGESTCVSCHDSFSLNSGSGIVMLSSLALDTLKNGFYADSTYTLNITIQQTDATLFGFGLEALNAKNENAGMLFITQSQKTQLVNATVGGKSRTNIIHKKNAGLASDSITFSMEWKAPSNESVVTFYLAANAANNDGGTSGDYVYSLSKSFTKIELPVAVSSSDKKEFAVYPNPASDWITIQVPDENVGYEFYLYNSSGQLVCKQHTHSFSIAGYPKGMYTIVTNPDKKGLSLKSNFIKL